MQSWLFATRSYEIRYGRPFPANRACKSSNTNCTLYSHHGNQFYRCCVKAKTKCRWDFASKNSIETRKINAAAFELVGLRPKATKQLFSKVWTKSWTNSEPMNVLQEGQPSSDVCRGQLAAWHRNSNKDKSPEHRHGGFR